MRDERTLCDRCKTPGAKSMGVFKERKSDAAGSMENWYNMFDLCGGCAQDILGRLFDLIDRELAVRVLKDFSVKTRLG